jgi:hypothetical protein
MAPKSEVVRADSGSHHSFDGIERPPSQPIDTTLPDTDPRPVSTR